MIKENKKLIIVTSVVTLLPMVVGLLLWNKLPDTMATHFDINNQADGYSSKAFAVFGIPGFIFLCQLICVGATCVYPKHRNINKKIYQVLLGTFPVVSLLVSSLMFAYSLGYATDIGFIMSLMIGVLYIALGNYIPKVKQNYTVGFRVRWTLDDEDNWYHTHRFGGKCMVIGGILMMAASPVINIWLLITVAFVPALLPILYSYIYYKKKQ